MSFSKLRKTRTLTFRRIGALTMFALITTIAFYSTSSASLDKKKSVSSQITAMSADPLAAISAPSRLATLSHLILPQAPPPPEAIATYAVDSGGQCTNTAKTIFSLNEAVCVKTTGVVLDGSRSVTWSNPASNEMQRTALSGSANDTFMLPATQTSVVNDMVVDNRGTWTVKLVLTGRAKVRASVTFTVKDPDNPVADENVYSAASNPGVAAGSNLTIQTEVSNFGPDAAANTHLTQAVPNNATFQSEVQNSGPTFTCTNPSVGGLGSSSCDIVSLARGARAVFTFVYKIDAGTATGTDITSLARVTSTTSENHTEDNNWTARASVTGASSGTTCALTCSDDVTKAADTTDGGGNPGAVVHFTPPGGEGDCGTITTDHCNDCFFPVGTTVVTSTGTGDSCSFNVTVTPANGTTVSCPSNKDANAGSDCEAAVDPGTATATGNNVTVSGSRGDGRPLTDRYPTGTTTITWTAYSHDAPGPYADAEDEESHRTGSASCIQTVTVHDVTPPTITCPANITRGTDPGSCSATIDPGTATATDNCDSPQVTGARSDNQPLDAPYPKGTTTITWTASDSSNTVSCSQTVTVNDTENPAITCPANITTDAEQGTCAAHVTPGTPTASDNCGSPTVTGSRSDGQPLTATYPVGTTTITWTATDSSGNHSSCNQTITVRDTQPPIITLNGQTPSMWPPNHKYSTFQVTNFVTSVFDNCDGSIPVANVVITKVTSDEIENGNGDGNTLNDIVIASNCKSVQLRSEREGDSNGRVYTIFFSVTDAAGNKGTASAKVVVPHNPGETPVDSGPHYTVTSNCP